MWRPLVLAALLPMIGSVAPAPADPSQGWQEIAWPFPRDAWPPGRAFRCTQASCGGELEVYLRPKLGFCNCATGVSGDSEVDAVSDVDEIADDFRPVRTGEPVTIDGMAGLTRAYILHMPNGTIRPAAGFAVSHRCDVIVAASQGASAGSAEARRGITALIEKTPVSAWLKSKLVS